MTISSYIFGPQLIGVIMYLAGIIMQKFPPKKINNWYGYRTLSSMKSQQTWDEANRYAAKLLAAIGMLCFVTGMAMTIALDYWMADQQKWQGYMLAITGVASVLSAVLVITLTERHLDKTFKN